jgi:hypothetical protein
LRELIPALGVRHGRGGSAEIPRAPFIHADLHAAQRFTRIGAYDAPADHARSGAWRRRLIPRRQLCRHHRADEEQAEEDDERQWSLRNNCRRIIEIVSRARPRE